MNHSIKHDQAITLIAADANLAALHREYQGNALITPEIAVYYAMERGGYVWNGVAQRWMKAPPPLDRLEEPEFGELPARLRHLERCSVEPVVEEDDPKVPDYEDFPTAKMPPGTVPNAVTGTGTPPTSEPEPLAPKTRQYDHAPVYPDYAPGGKLDQDLAERLRLEQSVRWDMPHSALGAGRFSKASNPIATHLTTISQYELDELRGDLTALREYAEDLRIQNRAQAKHIGELQRENHRLQKQVDTSWMSDDLKRYLGLNFVDEEEGRG